MKKLYYWLVRNGLGIPVGIVIGILGVLLWSICAHSQATTPAPSQTPKPQWMPVEQVGVDAKTGTPIMGCRVAGYILWRADEVDARVRTDKGIMHRKQIKWHESVEQTLLGDIHVRKHHECWPSGTTPGAK